VLESLGEGDRTYNELLGNVVTKIVTSFKRTVQQMIGTGAITCVDNQLSPVSHSIEGRKTYCFIDLGNIHNVLKDIDGRVGDDVVVYAFADKHFNGYGVNPPCSPNTILIQSNDEAKNSADVNLMWHVSWVCFNNKTPVSIHVVTKDKGFLSLEDLVKSSGHSMYFHTNRSAFLPFLNFGRIV